MAGLPEDLGKRLLGEVEVCGLDEILQLLRHEVETSDVWQDFHFPPLDRLVHAAATEARPRAAAAQTIPAPPIVELMSLASGGGKTHLLYHLCALAVVPTSLSGKQSSVVIIDTDGNFSVPRLAAQIRLLLLQHDGETDDRQILAALTHIHIFRPQSLTSTIATLESLPAYLFNPSRHHSFDRPISFIALDSASAFYWQQRGEAEDAAFLANTSTTTTTKSPASPSAYARPATALKQACASFNCPAVVTSWYLGPTGSHQQTPFRPALPPPWPSLPTLRLMVRRVPVRKFPPGISVQDARREAEERFKAVEEGRFECFVDGWGVDERRLGEGRGFGFRLLGEGLVVEEEK